MKPPASHFTAQGYLKARYRDRYTVGTDGFYYLRSSLPSTCFQISPSMGTDEVLRLFHSSVACFYRLIRFACSLCFPSFSSSTSAVRFGLHTPRCRLVAVLSATA